MPAGSRKRPAAAAEDEAANNPESVKALELLLQDFDKQCKFSASASKVMLINIGLLLLQINP